MLAARAYLAAREKIENTPEGEEVEDTTAVRAVTIAQMRLKGMDVSWEELVKSDG